MFKTLSSVEIKDDVGEVLLQDLKRKEAALKLSETAFQVAQGRATDEDLQKIWDVSFSDKVDHTSDLPLVEVSNNLEELIEQNYAEQGYRWRLDCLNKSLGSLRHGDFGFIFARPETGKTTFLASEVTSFLSQSSEAIVWFNNEEQGYKVMLRIYQAYFGVTNDQLLANPKRFRDEFILRTGGRFKLYDSATIGRKDVERIIDALRPGIVIYDQIDKITGFAADREDLRLGAIYQWARELAKNSHAAIGVCQADGTAEGVRYLTMDHVANAKTAKQAEADWILGIGKTHDDQQQDIRFLNISKNKLLGDRDSITDLRHGKFEVLIEPSIARYRDIIRFE